MLALTLTLGPCLLAAEQYVGTATDHTCLLRLGETEMVNLGISIKPKVQLYLAYARCGRSPREGQTHALLAPHNPTVATAGGAASDLPQLLLGLVDTARGHRGVNDEV